MTTKEICELFNISSQYLYELKNGRTTIEINGKKYEVKPKLIEGVDYTWERGNINWNEKNISKYFNNR